MVQILAAAQRKPSFGQRLSQGVGKGIDLASEMAKESKLDRQKKESTKKAGELAGVELTGNDELDKIILQQKMKDKRQQDLLAGQDKFLKGMRGQEPSGLANGDPEPQMPQEDPGLGNWDPNEQPKQQPQQGQPKGRAQTQPQKQKPRYSQEDIQQANIVDPSGKMARSFEQENKIIAAQQRHEEDLTLEKEKQAQTDFQKDREYHTQFSKPVIENANNVLATAPAKKGIMDQWERDIRSGKTSGLGNFLADKTSAEFWRTPESARAKSAGKEYFVESLRTLAPGARPNQFIEQQLVAALPTIGRDIESGLSVLAMQRYLDDLKEKTAELELEEAETDRESYGYAKQDIRERARKELKNYAEERQDKLAYDIRKFHEDNLDNKALANEITLGQIVPGTPLTERGMAILMLKNKDDVDAAIREGLKLGFELPRKK